MALSIGDRRLGSLLLDQGYLSDADLQKALSRHAEVGGRLADVLIDSGMVPERKIAQAIQSSLGLSVVDLSTVTPDPAAIAAVPGNVALGALAFPYALEGDTLTVAMIDPLSSLSIEALEDESGYDIKVTQALRSQVMWSLATYYPELKLEASDPNNEDQSGRLGQRLIARGWLNDSQLQVALDAQQQTGSPLGSVLIGQNVITENQLYEVLAEQAGGEFVTDVSALSPAEDVLGYLLRADAVRLAAVPVSENAQGVTVLTSDPRKRTEIEHLIDRPVQLMLALPGEVQRLLAEAYPAQGRIGEKLVEQGTLSREQLREALQQQAQGGKTKSLGDVIMELGFASSDEIEGAVQQQAAGGGRLEDTLVQSGKLSPEMLARSLAAQLGYEYLDPLNNQPDTGVVANSNIQEATARRYGVIPIRMQGQSMVVAMKDPRNVFALDDLKLITGRDIIPAVMPEKDITRLIERNYGASGMSDLKDELDRRAAGREAQAEDDSVGLDDNAIVKVVDNIIREAALQDVSDIHIEPTEHSVKVRYRIDGVLREQQELPKAAAMSVLARIKIMGRLDIAERRIPQDGRVRFKKGSIDIDLRLSTLPTVYGEKAVMRLLQKASNIPEVEQLGFSEYNMRRYMDVIDRPNGIFLVTGPTGSGKSFTSFSTLKRIAKPEKNTTTIEDPVEYEIPGINQSQVNNAAGMTFAKALKAFLRQDPDIIFVGEIRDQETAGIAVEAALTGHLVLATLHTNDAPGAITRLEEMGLESFNISAAVAGVLAQRLVRRVCNECKQPTNADPETLRRLGLSDEDIAGANLMRGAGCPRCNGTGYKGRMGIHELMVVDDPLRRAINAGKPSADLKDIAIEQSGMKTLRTDGIEKAMQGLTTLEEVLAVTAS